MTHFPRAFLSTSNSQPATSNFPLATSNQQLATRPAFTLVELMISLAMVLILILGINYVFRSATDAVSTGNNLNQINADAQSSQPIVFDDLKNVSKNPPVFIIASQLVTQFLNADDAKGGTDPNVIAIDNAGNYAYIGANSAKPTYQTVNPTSWISPAFLNSRNHRADLLKFFAHALYQRRSGPDGTYYASDTSNDAFIEFGHAALPANDLSAFYGPSALPVANFGYTGASDLQGPPAVQITGVPRVGGYAADWVLTRRATLMKDPTTITQGPPTSNDYYYPDSKGVIPKDVNNATFGADMTPLSYGTPDNNGAGITQLQASRYDLAGLTPEEFDRKIANAILTWRSNGYKGASLWWDPLVYALGMTQGAATPPQYFQMAASATNPNGAVPPYFVPYTNVVPANAGMPSYSNGPPPGFTPDTGQWYNRPQCNPTIQNPVTSASIAEMAPYFLQHCTQFVVEYAGDYMQQDANGNMVGLGPDGQIDYYLDANGNKHIRWYGMPRSSTGQLHDDGFKAQVLIRGFDSTSDKLTTAPTSYTGSGPMSILLNYFTDVIPLRDYYSLWFNTNPDATTPPGVPGAYVPPWEVDINFNATHDYGGVQSVPAAGAPYGIAFNDPNNPPRYVAAWHDDMPAMIRILIKVDDPNNKVKDGPWYEYVFKLK
jgi:prepilin-type N-terminal cleavage/methylation domain-containing protein